MDIRKVKKLIELLEESGIAELEIREGEESVRISRQSQLDTPTTIYAQPATIPVAAPPAMAAPTEPTPSLVMNSRRNMGSLDIAWAPLKVLLCSTTRSGLRAFTKGRLSQMLPAGKLKVREG